MQKSAREFSHGLDLRLQDSNSSCTTPPRPSEISEKNRSTKVKPFLTSHLWCKVWYYRLWYCCQNFLAIIFPKAVLQTALFFFISFSSEISQAMVIETTKNKCYLHCSDLLWEKIVLVIEKIVRKKKLLKFFSAIFFWKFVVPWKKNCPN